MESENDIRKSDTVVRRFWLSVTGYDTHHLGWQSAQRETPWVYFSANDILVCTLWEDHIVEIHENGNRRRFIVLAGKMAAWKGIAMQHGTEADERYRRAMRPGAHKRIVGYEAEPMFDRLGKRRVKRFHMDKVHELRVVGLERDALILDVDLMAMLEAANPELLTAIDPGTLFELLPLAGELPTGKPSIGQIQPESDAQTPSEEEQITPAVLERYADLTMAHLITYVLQQKDEVLPPITYGQVATEIGFFDKNGAPVAKGVGNILHRIQARLRLAETRMQCAIPHLTALVIRVSDTPGMLADNGVTAQWPEYAKLTPGEKIARTLFEYGRILDFGLRWLEVLKLFGLPLPETDDPTERHGAGGHGGGESDAHRNLKHYVCGNPQEFGADLSSDASMEYPLLSGDSIDVFFKGVKLWVGVEVKSRVSDKLPEDYQRGIYQCVKYQAVLRAMAAVQQPHQPPTVKVYLAVETVLPPRYRDLAIKLGINVKEGVGATSPR